MNDDDYDFNDDALKWADEVMREGKYRIAKEGAVASGRSMYLTATGWSLHFEGDHDKTACGDAHPASRKPRPGRRLCVLPVMLRDQVPEATGLNRAMTILPRLPPLR